LTASATKIMLPEEQLSLFSQNTASSIAELNTTNFDLIPTSSKMAIPPETYTSIGQIASHCQVCHRCGLGDTRINVVVGRGNEHAPILIVGEGPGQNEDEQGLPFVGRSGQLLEKILASVRLSIDKDVYISNVVRCRPPDNRVPTTAEIAACKPYLLEQIRLLNPKIILLTGVTAVKAVTGKKDAIGKIRGTWIEWEGRWCMPILHPAYLLRNPQPDVGKPKWLMWQDIQAVRAKLEELGLG
jgi:uracil-DNA glycosylase